MSYTAGLDYELKDNVLIYGKTSKGYRSGGHQLRAVDDISATPFGPETLTEYEVGIKSDLFDGRVRLNLAAYTNEIDGKQLSTIFVQPGTNQAFTLIQNAAQVETQGVEVEVTALVTDNLTISAGGALLDTEYSEFEDFSGDRSFERIPHVIGEEFSFAATYTKPLSFGDLSLRADYHWTGEYPTNPFTPAPSTMLTPDIRAILDGTTSEAVGILGARATLSVTNNLEIAVWGRNLTDELNYPNALYIGAPIDFVTRFPQAPRTFGASVTYKFGAAG